MCRQRGMTNFASRIAKGGVDEPAERDIEARIAPRPSEGIVRMTLLAVCQVGHRSLAVVVGVRPARRVPLLTVAERAVEATGFARIVGGEDRGPKMSPCGVALSADCGVRSVCVVDRIGMSRIRIGPPRYRRVGRPDRDAVRHVAGAGVPAGRKAAHAGYAAVEVGPVTELTTGETALIPGLRFGAAPMQGWVSPARGMSRRASGVAGLSIELGAETADAGDPPQKVAAVTPL